MSDDHVRSAVHGHRRAAGLARTINEDVYPYSSFYRQRFDRAGLARGSVRSPGDLARVPPTTYAELETGAKAVLQPGIDTIRSFGTSELRWRLRVADLLGNRAKLARDHVEPRYKPVLWLHQGRLELAWSADDLELLGEVGRRTLERAGVRAGDHVVTVSPPTPDLAFWQLSLGARSGGVAATHLGAGASARAVVAADPTVVAGHPKALLSLVRELDAPLPSVRTVIAAGAAIGSGHRRALAAFGPDVAVVNAWAPPGVRALWTECREGAQLHTWPENEVIEVLEIETDRAAREGELVWTGVGWRGTALVRLRTGVIGRVDEAVCSSCGRTTPRLAAASVGGRQVVGTR